MIEMLLRGGFEARVYVFGEDQKVLLLQLELDHFFDVELFLLELLLEDAEVFVEADAALLETVLGLLVLLGKYEYLEVLVDEGLADEAHELELVVHVVDHADGVEDLERLVDAALVEVEDALVVEVHGVLAVALEAVDAVERVGDVEALLDELVLRVQVQVARQDVQAFVVELVLHEHQRVLQDDLRLHHHLLVVDARLLDLAQLLVAVRDHLDDVGVVRVLHEDLLQVLQRLLVLPVLHQAVGAVVQRQQVLRVQLCLCALPSGSRTAASNCSPESSAGSTTSGSGSRCSSGPGSAAGLSAAAKVIYLLIFRTSADPSACESASGHGASAAVLLKLNHFKASSFFNYY